MKADFKKNLHILGIIIASICFLAAVLYLDRILTIIGTVLSAFSAFFIGLGIAFILNLPLNFFEKKVFGKFNHPKYKIWSKVKRPICIALSIIIILAILTLLFSFVLPEVINTIRNFIYALPDYMESLNATIDSLIKKFHLPLDTNAIDINWNSISSSLLSNYFSPDKESITVVTTVEAIIGICKGVFNFVLGIAFSIYILAAKENLSKLCKRILFSIMKRPKAEKVLSVATMSSKVFAGFVSGQCIEVCIIGCLCFIGMLIFNMKYAAMISCIIAITAFIPVFGALIGTVIGAFMLLLHNPIQALWFIIFIIVLQQVESNIIYPKIMGKSVGLPGIWVLLAVTVGGNLFGVVGMLLSVPTCSVLYCLLETWLNKRLHHRKICTHTFVDKKDEPHESAAVMIKTKITEFVTHEKRHTKKEDKNHSDNNNDNKEENGSVKESSESSESQDS